MHYFSRPAAWLVLIAFVFEISLGAIAIGIGGIFSHWSLIGLGGEPKSGMSALAAAGLGLIATAPMTLALDFVIHSQWRIFKELASAAGRLLAPLFRGVWQVELLVVAMAAGFGEEILFRGLIQAGLDHWWSGSTWGWLAAWLVASLLFGVCHWINGTYALLATLAGLYLGGLLIVTGNLIVPITAHAMYDLAALLYLANQGDDAGEEW